MYLWVLTGIGCYRVKYPTLLLLRTSRRCHLLSATLMLPGNCSTTVPEPWLIFKVGVPSISSKWTEKRNSEQRKSHIFERSCLEEVQTHKLHKYSSGSESNLIVHIPNMIRNLILPLYGVSTLIMIIAVLNMFNALFLSFDSQQMPKMLICSIFWLTQMGN